MIDCLSSDERERAGRFQRPLDRARFLAARGWLRRLLAAELLCDPGEVRMVTGEHGKPRLVSTDLRFSASRNAGVALYATSWSMDVGVDVEAIRPTAYIDRLAGRCFSDAEQRALSRLPAPQHLAACFQCWTCKEAYVKGIGAGLSFPLRSVDVWLGSTRRAVVSGWSIHQLDVAPGFAAAVGGAGTGEWIPSPAQKLNVRNPS